jgi:hypothetical protein
LALIEVESQTSNCKCRIGGIVVLRCRRLTIKSWND